MLRPDGEPRKCLPHQSNLCLNALEDRVSCVGDAEEAQLRSARLQANVSSVCCWHNAVDYFCCTNVPSEQCPTFSNVTVVIHSGQPMGPSPLKVFTFRKNIETDFDFT